MPKRNQNCRSHEISIAVANVLFSAALVVGCKSAAPEFAGWNPSPVPLSKDSLAHEAPLQSPESAVRGDETYAEKETATPAVHVQEDSSAVVTASLLRAADPLVLQQSDDLPSSSEQTGKTVDDRQDDAGQSPAKESNGGSDRDEGNEGATTLELQDVVASVRNAYPKIREAIARQAEASGQLLSSWGAFDTVLDGHTINQPLGFYENYRHGLGVKRPLWNGGYAGVGYRLGDGNFEPWYGERETDEGGEFKIGVDVPLLQNRAIDKRRVAIRTAELRRGQTNPELTFEILMAQGDAAIAYWTWVSSGQSVQIQEALLKLAEDRVEQISEEIRLGNVPGFLRLDNDRLIASRKIKLIDAERKFGQSAVKLSMYLRDFQGNPLLPDPQSIPIDFPEIPEAPIDAQALINTAIANRPETSILQFDISALRVELAQACNQILPELNLTLETSQDIGGQTSSKGDKQEAKIEAGVYGEVPLQRRAARGKINALNAKIRQVEAKLQLASDRISTEVQDLIIAREAALRQIDQAVENLEVNNQVLEAGNEGLRAGAFTLPILNIYEQSVADAQGALLLAKAEFFIADSLLRVAIGQELDMDAVPAQP